LASAPPQRQGIVIAFPTRRTLWIAAAFVLIVIAGTLLLSPATRTAIADRLGLPGIGIRWLDEPPAITPSPVGGGLRLGRPITLDQARDALDVPLLVPSQPEFDPPPEIYQTSTGDRAMIWFVYPAGAELPAAEETGVGALLTQFQGDTDRDLIEKGVFGVDGPGGAQIDPVSVGDERGFWITGAPHAVYFFCYGPGECLQQPARLAGNVLIWEHGDLTLRLESALSLEEALAIAESMQPLE
jgi:hypothetical protein